ncbi:hypothetical protein ACFOLF_24375 [Paenibacillus sepulcri]|uniref:EF-hand domain-containing protein n=1 Tax=Paenibacillus sepulcri TaxID=359917 RepID=A0ABS7BXU9_9BACL|nr:hypothetical protein [Paenibacillus sepulcri]
MAAKKISAYVKIAILLLGLLPVLPQISSAHFEPIGYSEIVVGTDSIEYSLYMDPYQLQEFVELDLNTDGYVDAEEVKEQEAALNAFMGSNLQVLSGGVASEPLIKQTVMTEKGKLPMIMAQIEYKFAKPVEDFEINYRFFQVEGFVHHINMAHIQFADREQEVVFNQTSTQFSWSRDGENNSSGHVSAIAKPTLIRWGIILGCLLLFSLGVLIWRRRNSAKSVNLQTGNKAVRKPAN